MGKRKISPECIAWKKRDIIADVTEEQMKFGETLISNNLISGFNVKVTLEDYRITIDYSIIPKLSLKFIDMKFIITPTGVQFE